MGPAPAVAATRLVVRAQLSGAGLVLVACSGGADSVALAAAVAFEAPRSGVRAGLVTVDHGLQDGSAEQAARVCELGHRLGLDPVESVRVEVGRAGGPEGAARAARYAALSEAAQRLGAERVLLAHTRDDQAETVLLGLGRGSGPGSIAGMRRRDGQWARPFLELDRATVLAACEAQELPVWHDPHNIDDRFVRVRVRREVLPLLEDVLHGGVAGSLARTADLLRDDLDALEMWADQAYAAALVPLVAGVPPAPAAAELDVEVLAGLPAAVRTRVLRRWAADRGAGQLTAGHTASLDELVTAWRGQGPVALPGGAVARSRSGTLGFVPNAQQRPQQE